MTQIFVASDVLSIVTRDRVMPVDRESEEGKAWIKENAKAMFFISSSMEYNQLEPLLTSVTAKQMWDRLVAIHSRKSSSNKLMLTQKFHEYRMGPTDSVVQRVSKMQNLATELLDLGENLSETTIMAKVLVGLTAKFSSFQTAWDSVEPERQTIENLQERLLREESRLNANTAEVTAFAAMKVSKSYSEVSNTKPKTDNRKRKKKELKDIEWFVCQKKGHIARNCPERKQNKDKESDKSDRDSGSSRQVAFVALCANVSETNGQSRIEHSRYKRPDSEKRREVLAVEQDDIWYIDSGCLKHVTFRRDWFAELCPRSDGDKIKLGDNGECPVTGEGTIIVDRLINGDWSESRIEQVLYVPGVKKNLYSVGMCTVRGYLVVFREDDALIVRGNEILVTGVKQSNRICRLLFRTRVQHSADEANVSTTSLKGWHERLGHLNKRELSELLSSGVVNGVKVRDKRDFFCDACSLGKKHRLPFQKIIERIKREPGEFFHSDVCGPMSQESIVGANYFVTYKDDASGYRQVFFVKHKSDVFETFKIVERAVVNKFGRAMKTFRTDNGGEYCNKQMRSYMQFLGIQHDTTAPYTLEQNGRAERDNQTIVECARTMLHAKQLGVFLWAEAVNTAVYLLNRVPATGEDDLKTPYEIWVGKKPDLGHVRVFGEESVPFGHVPKQFTQKFDARGKKIILVGYDGESTNYRLYHPDTKKVTVSRNVVFHECVKGETHSNDTSDDEDWLPVTPHEQLIELRENNVEERDGNVEHQVANRNVMWSHHQSV